MAMRSREEHLEWAKQRALEYLDQGESPWEALTSIMSDLTKHPDLKDHRGIDLCMSLMMIGNLKTPQEARHFIEGFR